MISDLLLEFARAFFFVREDSIIPLYLTYGSTPENALKVEEMDDFLSCHLIMLAGVSSEQLRSHVAVAKHLAYEVKKVGCSSIHFARVVWIDMHKPCVIYGASSKLLTTRQDLDL